MSSRSTASVHATTAHVEPPDTIAALIARLTAAAATGAEMTLGGWARTKVRRVPAGFTIEREQRP
jgi:hypothetical protein